MLVAIKMIGVQSSIEQSFNLGGELPADGLRIAAPVNKAPAQLLFAR